LLSGGFDSRLIACLLERAGVRATALSVRHSTELLDADSRFAAAFARARKIPLERVQSSADFFSSPAYLDYLFDSDAATPSLYLFISQVAQFIGAEPVWEGLVPGCTLTALHQPPGGFSAFLRRECKSADSAAWADARTLFEKKFCDAMADGFEADLRREIDHYSDDGHGVFQFVVRNRSRNRASINPLKVFESRTRAFLPGLTRDYFDLAGALPFEARQAHRLYLTLLRDYFPEALCCPIVSGSTMIKTSAWSPSYYANQAAARALHIASAYPRLFRRVGIDASRLDWTKSRFEGVSLIDEQDENIASSQLSRQVRTEPLTPGASKLLFHWLAWRRLHDGTLSSFLQ
jgi:hypothetical protein